MTSYTSGVTRRSSRSKNASSYVRATAAAVVALAVAALTAGTVAGAAAVEPAAAESKKAVAAGKASATDDGFVRTGSHKGDSGYNEDDAFGDKDSDSYGFGTQVSYGNKAGDGGLGAYHESTAYDDRGRSNPKYSAWHFEEKDGKPTKRYVYDSHHKKNKQRHDPLTAVQEAEASEYDSVEAYDDDGGDAGGTHAGYETEEAEPEYGNLYDSADAYNDADTYY